MITLGSWYINGLARGIESMYSCRFDAACFDKFQPTRSRADVLELTFVLVCGQSLGKKTLTKFRPGAPNPVWLAPTVFHPLPLGVA